MPSPPLHGCGQACASLFPLAWGGQRHQHPQEQEVGAGPTSSTSAGLCLTSAAPGSLSRSSAQASGDGRGKRTWRQGRSKKCHSSSWESPRPVQARPALTPLPAGTAGCFPPGMGSPPGDRTISDPDPLKATRAAWPWSQRAPGLDQHPHTTSLSAARKDS